ncbi:MAG: AAA family ATPase [Bacteroidota bacterium]
MIKSIQLTNFFSFKEELIPLHENINSLIGVNGAGKTNVLKAVELLKKLGQENGLQNWMETQGGFEQVYCRVNDLEVFPQTIGLSFTFDAEKLAETYDVELPKELIQYKIKIIKASKSASYTLKEEVRTVDAVYEEIVDETRRIVKIVEQNSSLVQETLPLESMPHLSSLAQINSYHKSTLPLHWAIKAFTQDIELYPYFDVTPNSPMRQAQIIDNEKNRLLSDGQNLAQVLWHIKNNYSEQYEEILKKLWSVNYNNKALEFNFTIDNQLELFFVEEQLNAPTSIKQVSDGILQKLCLLAILLNPDRGKFICIEKPEEHIYPFQRNFSISSLYHIEDSTFLYTTHYPELTDSLRVHHIITVMKFNQNVSEIDIYTEDEFKGIYDRILLSELWNNGEIGR